LSDGTLAARRSPPVWRIEAHMKNIRVRVVAAWAVAILLALFFVQSGASKLGPSSPWVGRFEAWGYTGSLAPLIGVIETAGAFLALAPSLAAYGALMISAVMIGAIYTHLSTGIGSAATAAQMLVLSGALIALRARDARPLGKASRKDHV
jgi:putative oxidoreductase